MRNGDEFRCPVCGGKGEVSYNERTEYEEDQDYPSGVVMKPQEVSDWMECSYCKGEGTVSIEGFKAHRRREALSIGCGLVIFIGIIFIILSLIYG